MKKFGSGLAAIIVAVICYFPARLPTPSEAETAALTARFTFTKLPLAEIAEQPPYKFVRQVHPSLERISAWISAVGAAATLADLDGDGLPNDLIHVDPRTDLVTISCVPGTRERYKPFALDQSSWSHGSYDVSTIAPMGSIAGDFNEDGLLDVMVYFWGRTPILYLQKPAALSGPNISQKTSAPAERDLSADVFVARELVDSGERWYSDCATQADFDGDGHIDLLIGNYFQDGARILDPKASGTETLHQGKAKALNGGYKHLFLWQAGGDFPSVTYRQALNVFREEVGRGWTVALGAADLDGDLLPEIYFANDFGPDRTDAQSFQAWSFGIRRTCRTTNSHQSEVLRVG